MENITHPVSNFSRLYPSRSESTAKLFEALSKAQAEIRDAEKNSSNPHYKHKYADLSAVLETIREPLSKYGLALVQTIEPFEKGNILITILGHTSGEWISSRIPLIMAKNTMQDMGSAITYARRYGASAIVGITQADDDANAASGKIDLTNQPSAKVTKPKEESKSNVTALKSKSEPRLSLATFVERAGKLGWSEKEIARYMLEHFNKSEYTDLTQEEYDKLREAIKSTHQEGLRQS
jgi:hypothetical protein